MVNPAPGVRILRKNVAVTKQMAVPYQPSPGILGIVKEQAKWKRTTEREALADFCRRSVVAITKSIVYLREGGTPAFPSELRDSEEALPGFIAAADLYSSGS